jgi:hypothetical protein
MRHAVAALLTLGLVAAAGAAGHDLWDLDDARIATKVEIQVDKAGRILEIEFHVPPDAIPAVVRAAMDRLHPGGPFTDAEIERDGTGTYYELSRVVNGMEVEAMFTAGGELVSEEIQVAESSVPETVRSAVSRAYPGGAVAKWEEIRDKARQLVEYHVKLTFEGRKHKVMLDPAGALLRAVYEIPAEVEVPAPLPRR